MKQLTVSRGDRRPVLQHARSVSGRKNARLAISIATAKLTAPPISAMPVQTNRPSTNKIGRASLFQAKNAKHNS